MFSIPEIVIQTIVVSAIQNFDTLLFNIIISSQTQFSESNTDVILQKVKEVQKALFCISRNFPEAFEETLNIISIAQTLIKGGATVERINKQREIWRIVAERTPNYFLPDEATLETICQPVERSLLIQSLPNMEYHFSFDWLFVLSADYNYDND